MQLSPVSSKVLDKSDDLTILYASARNYYSTNSQFSRTTTLIAPKYMRNPAPYSKFLAISQANYQDLNNLTTMNTTRNTVKIL